MYEMISFVGHFEKGAWVPGALDNISGAVEQLGDAFKEFGKAVWTLRETEAYGRFEKGKWVSVTMGDLAQWLEQHSEHLIAATTLRDTDSTPKIDVKASVLYNFFMAH